MNEQFGKINRFFRSLTPRREIALNLALLLSTGAWFSASASVTTNAWLITIARLSVGSHLKKTALRRYGINQVMHYLISKNEMSYNMAKTYIMLLISGFADIISTVGLIQKTDLINKQVGSSNWYYVILSSTAFDQDMFKNASKINDLITSLLFTIFYGVSNEEVDELCEESNTLSDIEMEEEFYNENSSKTNLLWILFDKLNYLLSVIIKIPAKEPI
ncbi:hypothetical protein BDF21DRAFT_455745 [Thamnidium elegans]|nr:hypothetical protein BDF21DRAFT_455745 [Thamnidium elegans]